MEKQILEILEKASVGDKIRISFKDGTPWAVADEFVSLRNNALFIEQPDMNILCGFDGKGRGGKAVIEIRKEIDWTRIASVVCESVDCIEEFLPEEKA